MPKPLPHHQVSMDQNTTIRQDNPAIQTREQNDDVRFILDHRGCIVFASDGFTGLFDIEAQDCLSKPAQDFIDFREHDDVFRVGSMFGQEASSYLDSLVEGTYDVIFKRGDADIVTVKKLRFDKVTRDNGRDFAIALEVTEDMSALSSYTESQKWMSTLDETLSHYDVESPKSQNETALISSISDSYEYFLDMTDDVMAVCRMDGTFLSMNAAFRALLGLNDDDDSAACLNFMDQIHGDDRSHVRPSFQSLSYDEDGVSDQMIDYESRVVSYSGDVHHFIWRQKRRGDLMYLVGQNVTAAKSHENDLWQKESMLSEAEAIGHMGHWRWVVGDEHITWSDEIYRIFGVDRAGFKPTIDNVNTRLHRRDLGRLMQAFQRAIIEKNNYDMDFRIQHLDGTERYVRCEGRCELDDDGDVIALFGIMQDITEVTMRETELEDAKEAAERAYAAKSQFLANMSHELRTPLNAIIGFSEMMQRQLLGPIGTEKYLDYITGIRESGEHLLDLISDILDMSKIEAGKYELDLEELNTAKVIRMAVHMIDGRAQDAKINLTMDLQNEDLQMVADRRALMQILLNLLSNAVKFTDPGGNVVIECLERDNYICIRVHDTGIGIPANKLHCITHPFEQAANHYTREHEGTGLGLAITKDLIELHGGSLHIASTVGVGTTVTVRLPYNAYDEMKKQA